MRGGNNGAAKAPFPACFVILPNAPREYRPGPFSRDQAHGITAILPIVRKFSATSDVCSALDDVPIASYRELYFAAWKSECWLPEIPDTTCSGHAGIFQVSSFSYRGGMDRHLPNASRAIGNSMGEGRLSHARRDCRFSKPPVRMQARNLFSSLFSG